MRLNPIGDASEETVFDATAPITDPVAVRLSGVQSVDPAVWARNGFDIAFSSVERLQKSVLTAAQLLGEGRRSDADRCLLVCLDGLDRLSEALSFTRAALNVDFALHRAEGRTLAQLETTLNGLITAIRECHENEDWEGLTDHVEYGLLTNLHAWNKALSLLRRSHQ